MRSDASLNKEFAGDHLSMEVREVIGHYGEVIVRARFDGTYDKANLPAELDLTSCFTVSATARSSASR